MGNCLKPKDKPRTSDVDVTEFDNPSNAEVGMIDGEGTLGLPETYQRPTRDGGLNSVGSFKNTKKIEMSPKGKQQGTEI